MKATLLFQTTGMKKVQEVWWRRGEKVEEARESRGEGMDPCSFSSASAKDAAKLSSSLCFFTQVIFPFWSDLGSPSEVLELLFCPAHNRPCFGVSSALRDGLLSRGSEDGEVQRSESESALACWLEGLLGLPPLLRHGQRQATAALPGTSPGSRETWRGISSGHRVPIA